MSDLRIVHPGTGEILGSINEDRYKRIHEATQRANLRERSIRYGNSKQIPGGLPEAHPPRPYGLVKPKRLTIGQAVNGLVPSLGVGKRPKQTVIRSVPARPQKGATYVRGHRHGSSKTKKQGGFWAAVGDLTAIVLLGGAALVVFWLASGPLSNL